MECVKRESIIQLKHTLNKFHIFKDNCFITTWVLFLYLYLVIMLCGFITKDGAFYIQIYLTLC